MNPPNKKPSVAAEGEEVINSAGEREQDSAGWDVAHEAVRPTAELDWPPGLTGDIARYVFNNAHRPMREGAILASLGLMAGVAGRSYNINGDGLNLYLLLLAGTGRGKEAMASGIDRLLLTARSIHSPNTMEFLGPSEFASGEALLRHVSQMPNFLSIFGEFGETLNGLSDPRANPTTRAQRKVMLDLYNKSGAGRALQPRAYSDKAKNTDVVRSPAVSILCESTPEIVYESLTYQDIARGLLPRFLILQCHSKRPKRNRQAGMVPPSPTLVDSIQNLANVAWSSLMDRENPPITDIVINEEAQDLLDDIDDELDEIYNDATHPIERELWNRAIQNIHRVAGLLAVGLNMHAPVVDADCVEWAQTFVYGSVGALQSRFEAGQIGSVESRQEAEVRKFIREYVEMKPGKRQFSYKVNARIAGDGTIIPWNYLLRRAMQCSAFTNDRYRASAALKTTLSNIVDSGQLVQYALGESQMKFGVRQVTYQLYGEGLLR